MKLKSLDPLETRKRVLDLVDEQNRWRSSCINLIASENVMSPLAERAYLSDFMHRYAEGEPFARYYNGTKYVDEIEVLAQDILGELLKARFVDPRPISGTVANLSTLSSLTKPGDTIISLSTPAGGHISHNRYGAPTALGLRVYNYAFDYNTMNIDVDTTRKEIKEKNINPKVFILGASLFLFPHPIREILDLVSEYNAILVYDAAHVLGLIAGKEFQDPLSEGAHIITSSTHKTFPGPQGGLMATNLDGLFSKLKKGVFPRTTSNHHLHRLPALAITGLEMMEFGQDYARRVVENARELGRRLHELGIPVVAENLGFTRSHQIVIDMAKLDMSGQEAADIAEKANIIVNKNLLPWESLKDVKNPSGIRIGVQEMTRFGMGKGEMRIIAEFLYRIWVKKEDPRIVREDVSEFRKEYQKVIFTW